MRYLIGIITAFVAFLIGRFKQKQNEQEKEIQNDADFYKSAFEEKERISKLNHQQLVDSIMPEQPKDTSDLPR